MKKPKALVLYGDGINCDMETAWALEQAGFDATRVHTTKLLKTPKQLEAYQLMVLPGGFSFGDEIASGKILALEFKERVGEVLHEFIDRSGFVMGICNGFQILVQLGILPNSNQGAPKTVSFTRNIAEKFINRWVTLDVAKEIKTPFFEGLLQIDLPIRHGEGRLTIGEHADVDTRAKITRHIALRYRHDINGSFDKAAALTNARGNVLGLMPHPEAFVRWSQHPAWTDRAQDKLPDGLAILKNVAKAVS